MHKVIGEATPIYMYWNKSIKRIYNYNPNIKLILILRNPATRAFSHWNMEYEKHKEKDDFFVAIKKEKNREKRGIYKQSRVFSYLKRGLYSRQINKILEYFDRRQLMIIRSKELKDNPQKTLSQIAEFLQISPFGYFESKKIHSGKYKRKINENEKFFLKNFYRNEIDTLESLLNWDLSEWKNYSP
jgi:hypothetical protein